MEKLSSLIKTRKRMWAVIIIWILVVGALSAAPSAQQHTINTGEFDLPADAHSVVASEKVEEHFPDESGLLALLVLEHDSEWSAGAFESVDELSESLWEQVEEDSLLSSVPFHFFPEDVKEEFVSDDQSTLVLPVTLPDGLEMDEINAKVEQLHSEASETVLNAEVNVTGPAGIASDTITIFSNANLVLLFSTIGLVLVLLIIIYRSPLLALIPLLAALFVYQTVDRVLGLFAANDVFYIETQSLSIVSILLFGATVDYSLFIFSRFKEELRQVDSKHEAMVRAVTGVARPIFFSGGTVLAAMLVLFLAVYGPYQNFAPVFSITIAIVLIAGLTLVPALFTAFGRRAFWPDKPKVGEDTLEKNRFWSKMGNWVTKKPFVAAGIVLVFLIVNGLNVMNINYSFNLLNSFPEEMDSRVGYEKLEEQFPPGELAPVVIVLESEEEIVFSEEQLQELNEINTAIVDYEGVSETTLPSHDVFKEGDLQGETFSISEDETVVKLEALLAQNPYDHESLDTLEYLINEHNKIIEGTSFSGIYFAGESAQQSEIRAYNERDTAVVVAIVTLVILAMLMWQLRSVVAPIYMMTTILISYFSALGISWFIFDNFLGYEGMSYRIPLYAFVFLVALGVDYNIMLMSRIREERQEYEMKEAVRRGVALTGGVISSAGIILAGTFGVLMTQPILELFMFGFIVSLGILVDAFLVRGMLVPAIATILKR
ncbi:MMPL family transporter [Alkalibacillus haloalkaliphilus]|uniref:Membrane protein n=1 Tax=Alkalibacillus haloalkaliphilus TaxID=94136 RepID=A0A511W1B7_9BACI|nr:MMPL family transporter [Alkalibacillus haloalkaliphilus]GEN44551.1 membrane protein [Alkalibacillus haloalkaliphilus]